MAVTAVIATEVSASLAARESAANDGRLSFAENFQFQRSVRTLAQDFPVPSDQAGEARWLLCTNPVYQTRPTARVVTVRCSEGIWQGRAKDTIMPNTAADIQIFLSRPSTSGAAKPPRSNSTHPTAQTFPCP